MSWSPPSPSALARSSGWHPHRRRCLVFREVAGVSPATISAIAIVATLNTILAQMTMAARVAYGLARQGELLQAKYHLECAVRAGVPLDQPNRESEISGRHSILATLLLKVGDTNSAIREYRSAIAAYPLLYDAHLKLGELLITDGHTATAREHLSLAAQSPNTALRAAAEKLLAAIAPAK